MATNVPAQQPSPELLFDTLNAYLRTNALKAAIELDVFTQIGRGMDTAADLARECRASVKGLRVLCDFLVVVGFLTKSDGRYGLTLDTRTFLDRSSPAYMGSIADFLTHPGITSHAADIAAVVRKGGTLEEDGTISPENPIWVTFAKGMMPMMRMPAEAIAGLLQADGGQPCKVLDIAAGHGVFGITIARRNPKAEIVALDWPKVLEVAQENAEAAGVAARYSLKPGSAFEVEFGGGYDVVLLTNFLHHFDIPTCEDLLRKVHKALKPGGRVVILEFVPNEDRVSPPRQASFAMIMLTGTPSGDAYTRSEYEAMLRNTGYVSSEVHPLPPTPQTVILATKK